MLGRRPHEGWEPTPGCFGLPMLRDRGRQRREVRISSVRPGAVLMSSGRRACDHAGQLSRARLARSSSTSAACDRPLSRCRRAWYSARSADRSSVSATRRYRVPSSDCPGRSLNDPDFPRPGCPDEHASSTADWVTSRVWVTGAAERRPPLGPPRFSGGRASGIAALGWSGPAVDSFDMRLLEDSIRRAGPRPVTSRDTLAAAAGPA